MLTLTYDDTGFAECRALVTVSVGRNVPPFVGADSF